MSSQDTRTNELSGLKPTQENTKAPAFLIPVFKLPLILYRLGLGWILGTRFMLLTHVGRQTGKVRRTILAVLSFDPKTREIIAISAWRASAWYYNIQAAPTLSVETGFTRYAPIQRDLTPEEIATLFEEYCRKNPIFSRIVCKIPGWKWDSSYEEFLELARTLRGVAFRPK